MEKIEEAIKSELSLNSATRFLLFFSKGLLEEIHLDRFGNYSGECGWIINRKGDVILDKKGNWFHRQYGYEIKDNMEEHDINFDVAWSGWGVAKSFVFETKEEAFEFAKKTFANS